MKLQKRFISAAFVLAALLIGGSAFAQEAQADKTPAKPGDVLIFEREISGPHGQGIRMPAPPGDDTMIFLSSEMSFGGKVVKGAPYSAQAVTETTRTLSDGNRIKRTTTASIYRDSEGRTRRDQELGSVGPWAVPGDPQQTVFINDPVAGVNYVLDPRTRTARKMPPLRVEFRPRGSADVAPAGGSGARIRIEREGGAGPDLPPLPPGEGVRTHDVRIMGGPDKVKNESLGKQIIEGVVADGTRTTMTIPAGEVGNEQPILIVFEKWYSPELQTVVMTKHSDPFVGETVYRLTNILRGEPARSLFEVPADYTVKELPVHTRVFRKKAGEEK